MGNITLSDVQTIMESYETRREARHIEMASIINGRFDKLDERLDTHNQRIHQLELIQAANAPVLKGAFKVTILLVGGLIAGYVGTLFANGG